jgi:hypothetical protein
MLGPSGLASLWLEADRATVIWCLVNAASIKSAPEISAKPNKSALETFGSKDVGRFFGSSISMTVKRKTDDGDGWGISNGEEKVGFWLFSIHSVRP